MSLLSVNSNSLAQILIILQTYLVVHIIRQVFIVHEKVNPEYGTVIAGHIGVLNLCEISRRSSGVCIRETHIGGNGNLRTCRKWTCAHQREFVFYDWEKWRACIE